MSELPDDQIQRDMVEPGLETTSRGLNLIERLQRSVGSIFRPDREEKLSTRHEEILIQHGYHPLKVLRGEGYHRFPAKIVAGVEIVECWDNDGGLKVVRVTDKKLTRRTLENEIEIVDTVEGKRYESPSGWTLTFPASVDSFSDKKVYGVVMPYYEGDEGEMLTKEYSDKDLADVAYTAITGLAALAGEVSDEDKEILSTNLRGIDRRYNIGRRAIYPILLRSGLTDKDSIKKLYRLQAKEKELADSLPPRLVHNDLHTFNMIPNSEKKEVTLIDLSLLGYGKGVRDIGRVLGFMLISDREQAADLLEEKLVNEGVISREGIQIAKAGALIDWGFFITRMEPNTEELRNRLERGKEIWRGEVAELQNN